jgi:hypothetical protein
MSEPTIAQRALILSALRDRVETLFGPEGTTGRGWFRKVVRGLWHPGGQVLNACTVVDTGCRRGERGNSDETKGRTLLVLLYLDLRATWDREEDLEDWTERVERINIALENWSPGYGVLSLKAMSDDPFEVEIGAGATAQHWMLEFEIGFFVAAGAWHKE